MNNILCCKERGYNVIQHYTVQVQELNCWGMKGGLLVDEEEEKEENGSRLYCKGDWGFAEQG